MLETVERPPRAVNAEEIFDRLELDGSPALVLAPFEARVVAANGAGAAVLGLSTLPRAEPPGSQRRRGTRGNGEARKASRKGGGTGDTPTADYVLDSAMPAVARLRRLLISGALGEHPVLEPLVFWTAAGARRVLCRIRAIAEDAADDRMRVLVEPMDAPAERKAAERKPDEQKVGSQASGDDWYPAAAPEVVPEGAPEGAPPSMSLANSSPIEAPPLSEPGTVLTAPLDHSPANDAAATAVPSADDAAATLPPPAPEPPQTTLDSALPPNPLRAANPPPRTDADILRAIARQIMTARGAAADTAPAADATEAAAAGPCDATEPLAAEAATLPEPEQQQVAAPPTDPAATDPAATEPCAAVAAPAPTITPSAVPAPREPVPIADAETRTLTRRLAHELKSPLSAIVVAAEIMKDERFGPIGDERYLRYVRDIHESARHTLEVIQRMLGAEVDDATAAELSFTNLDLNALIATLVSSSSPLADAASLTLVQDLYPGLPLVIADATSMRQIVLNLISNALKFTPAGGIVSIKTCAEIDGPVSIEIADSGNGMSDAEIARALNGSEPDIAPRKGGGLGIGIPLVRSLTTANGATLTLANRPQGGLVATITFPKSRQVLL